MKVKTLMEIQSAKGIIPAGKIIEIPPAVMEKLKGKVEPLQGNTHTSKANSSVAEIVESGVNVETLWQPEMREIIKWFMDLEAPTEPFYLKPHINVIEPGKFFMSLRREIEAGPSCPRGRNGALLYDLNKLRKILH